MSQRDEQEAPGPFEVVTLRNGARAIRHTGHGEVMHPSIGPAAEAQALYVDQPRLAERLARPGPALRILDVGLGAAANACAALACAAGIAGPRRELELISFENDLTPLRLALAEPPGFPYLVPFREAATALAETGRFAGEGLRWELRPGDLRETLPAERGGAELVFFDPFSPARDPQLWGRELLALVRARCSDDALLLTYSAATPTRAALLLAGFFVGAGAPVGTKGETTVAATRPGALERPLGSRWLERWRRSSARAPHGEPLTEELAAQLLAHPQFAAGMP